MQYCDLHIHSNCSDGTFTPEQLIEIAKESNLKAIALTDHNTIVGLNRFLEAAKDSGVIAVPGVEVTTAYQGKEVHILGLFLKEEYYDELTEYLAEINRRKEENNRMLAKTLRDAGYDLEYEQMKKKHPGIIPNRVHFALELVEKGVISTVSEAFETILAEGGAYYKPAMKLDTLDVIRFLNSIDAVTVVAHPLFNLTVEELHDFLPKAKACGLKGMEVIYTLHSEEDTKIAYELADTYGLLISGGSDFHGTNKPDIKMGRGKDNIEIPFEVYEHLKQ